MGNRRRIHDGIVGALITAGVAAGYWVSPAWLAVPGAIGLLMIQSWVTSFCSVYFILDLVGVKERSASAH